MIAEFLKVFPYYVLTPINITPEKHFATFVLSFICNYKIHEQALHQLQYKHIIVTRVLN